MHLLLSSRLLNFQIKVECRIFPSLLLERVRLFAKRMRGFLTARLDMLLRVDGDIHRLCNGRPARDNETRAAVDLT